MTWQAVQARRLTGGFDEVCYAKHGAHTTVEADTAQGRMTVYDADRYQNVYGFCPADDVVSRTLLESGEWEIQNREALWDRGILDSPEPGETVIDFGCQVGWYTRMAARAGFRVLAFDAVAESLALAVGNGGTAVTGCRAWIDADTPELDPEGCPPIRLVKADIEGNEEHALRVVWPLLDAGLVDHLLLEMSPVFNPSYRHVADRLRAAGYTAYRPHAARDWDWVLDFDQADILFTRP